MLVGSTVQANLRRPDELHRKVEVIAKKDATVFAPEKYHLIHLALKERHTPGVRDWFITIRN